MANPKGNPQNLRKGGKPGNKGGPGRLPSQLRAACREGFATAIPIAIAIAQGQQPTSGNPDPTPTEILRAVDLLGKYGMGELKAVLPEEFAEAAARVFAKYVPADKIQFAVAELLAELRGE